VIPLPFITLFWAFSTRASMKRPFEYQSLMMAHDLDIREPPKNMNEDSYLDPAFVFDQEDHDTVVSQCSVLKSAQAEAVWPNETIATLAEDGKDAEEASDVAFHDVEDQ
jgi:hypothetical protein